MLRLWTFLADSHIEVSQPGEILTGGRGYGRSFYLEHIDIIGFRSLLIALNHKIHAHSLIPPSLLCATADMEDSSESDGENVNHPIADDSSAIGWVTFCHQRSLEE